jgi:MFS family permease
MDGLPWDGKLKQDSFTGFAIAIVIFSLASSIFFTPLPIFLHGELQLSTSLVFVAYILNSTGATIGYFFIGRRARTMNVRKQMPRFVLLRGLLLFTLVAVVQLAFSTTLLTGLILVLLGLAYALYYILMLSLSMELIPAGRSGVFDVLVGLGAAAGAFLGPFLAKNLNYLPTFLIAGFLFLGAFVVLKIFS